jgi:hypothetical protein
VPTWSAQGKEDELHKFTDKRSDGEAILPEMDNQCTLGPEESQKKEGFLPHYSEHDAINVDGRAVTLRG